MAKPVSPLESKCENPVVYFNRHAHERLWVGLAPRGYARGDREWEVVFEYRDLDGNWDTDRHHFLTWYDTKLVLSLVSDWRLYSKKEV